MHKWQGHNVIGVPCDGGLYQVNAAAELVDLAAFRRNPAAALSDYVQGCEPVATAIAHATRRGKTLGSVGWQRGFREPAGAGWALVGDAGYLSDPCGGRGISDAFRQADALAPVIMRHLSHAPQDLDRALAPWGRQRDLDFAPFYWQTIDMGKAGPSPAPAPALLAHMYATGRLGEFTDMLSHRRRPDTVLTPARGMRAAAATFIRTGCDRRALLRELRAFATETPGGGGEAAGLTTTPDTTIRRRAV
jgi:hypothetical protein